MYWAEEVSRNEESDGWAVVSQEKGCRIEVHASDLSEEDATSLAREMDLRAQMSADDFEEVSRHEEQWEEAFGDA